MEDFENYSKLIDFATETNRGDLPGGGISESNKNVDNRTLSSLLTRPPKYKIIPISDLEVLQIASISREEDCRQLFVDVRGLSPLTAAQRILTLQRNNSNVEIVPVDSSLAMNKREVT